MAFARKHNIFKANKEKKCLLLQMYQRGRKSD